MSLLADIETQFKTALKAQDKVKLGCLRLLRTALKNRQVEKRSELTDEDARQAIATQIKRRREAIEAYNQAGAPERAAAEQAELEYLEGFLPPSLTPTEVEAVVDRVIAESGAVSPKDMGKVMKLVMAELSGRADGRTINVLVKAKLTAG